MAGSKVNDYGIGDTNATSIMETLDTQRYGYHAISLTNYDNTTKPAIAAGSKVEINGALFKFDSEEAISGTPSDGSVYILLSPSGDSVTASFTNTAPTWSDSKQGWYGTGGNANYRYANFIMTKSGASYSDKRFYPQDPETKPMLALLDTDNFLTQSIDTNGYIKLGSLYIQWGQNDPIIGAGTTTINLPMTFPNSAYAVTINGGSTSTFQMYAQNLTTSNFQVVTTGAGTTPTIYFIAVGS